MSSFLSLDMLICISSSSSSSSYSSSDMHQPGKPWKDRSLEWRLRRMLHVFRACIPINIMTFIHSGAYLLNTLAWRFCNIYDFLRQMPVINAFRYWIDTRVMGIPNKDKASVWNMSGRNWTLQTWCLLVSNTGQCALYKFSLTMDFVLSKQTSLSSTPNCSAPKANYKVQTTESTYTMPEIPARQALSINAAVHTALLH